MDTDLLSERDPNTAIFYPTYQRTMDTDLLSERDPNTAIFYQTYQPMEVLGRGVSSVVRRMLYRKSGQSYAVKIIDVSRDIVDADGLNLREQTMREINILRLVG